MRIIAGSLKGRRIAAPAGGETTRPTADRTKEALFSILLPYVRDAAVLDLFAGSGALALEAISRGARSAVLCDIDPKAQAAIEQNLRDLSITDCVRLLRCDANAAIHRLRGCKFDLIFLDPPYGAGLLPPALEAIAREELLEQEGILVVETSSKQTVQESPGWKITDQRRYGAALLTFMHREAQT